MVLAIGSLTEWLAFESRVASIQIEPTPSLSPSLHQYLPQRL